MQIIHSFFLKASLVHALFCPSPPWLLPAWSGHDLVNGERAVATQVLGRDYRTSICSQHSTSFPFDLEKIAMDGRVRVSWCNTRKNRVGEMKINGPPHWARGIKQIMSYVPLWFGLISWKEIWQKTMLWFLQKPCF